MKKYKIILLVILIFCSCVKENYDNYIYSIKNDSGKTVTVKSYLSDFSNVPPIITNLSAGEEITKTYTTRNSYSFADFFGDGDSFRDSIVVIYENQRIEVFNTNDCENIRNPLNICEYNSLIETFIFSEEDYLNAEPCNGNCD